MTKFKRYCGRPGCPAKTIGTPYCDKHQLKQDERRRRELRGQNNRSLIQLKSRKLYSTAKWKAIRKEMLSRYPLCQQCEIRGRITPAREIDHKLPLVLGGSNLLKNLQALCSTCHKQKTAKDQKMIRVAEAKRNALIQP